MIVYYSGTGNSKYCAKMLAELLEDETVDATEYIRNGIAAELTSEKPWVFLSPVYVSATPRIFDDFVKSGTFSGNKKAWFIMTCAGGTGASPVFCEALCKDGKFEYMGTAQVEMPQNYLVFFTTKEKPECDRIIAAAEPVVQALAQRIKDEKPFDDSGMKRWELTSTNWILEPYYKWFMNAYSNWDIDDYGDQNFNLFQSIDTITIKSGIKNSKLKYETSFTLDDNSLYLDVKNNYNKHRNVTYDFDFNHERIITLYVNNKDGLKLFNDLAHYIQLDYLRCNDIDNCNGDAEDTDIFMYKDSFYKDYYKL
mgnify:CR=1 FL=1